MGVRIGFVKVVVSRAVHLRVSIRRASTVMLVKCETSWSSESNVR